MNYLTSLLLNKRFNQRLEVNKITRRLFEAGILTKWIQNAQRKRKREIEYIPPLEMTLLHLYYPLIFAIFLGSAISIVTFAVERIISKKMKQSEKHWIWPYFEQFFDGHRYYFNDWAIRLQNAQK